MQKAAGLSRSSGSTARARTARDLLTSRGFGERRGSEDAGFAPPLVSPNPVIGALSRAPIGVQAKLTIGPVDDPLEREADRVAHQVMRMPDPALSFSVAPAQVSRKCAACEEEDKQKLQMKSAAGGDLAGAEAPAIVREVLREAGQPLDAATRAFFEPRFGYDFGGVRIHNEDGGARSARSLNARAYTFGNAIVFNIGEYRPGIESSKRLIAHELTHVIQQDATQRRRRGGGAGVTSARAMTAETSEPRAETASEGAAASEVALASPPGLALQAAAPVNLTGVTVNHHRVTVPPLAGLSFSAAKQPANASGVTFTLAGDNATIAGGTTIDSATGAIHVAAGQTGGSAHARADQMITLPDGSTVTNFVTAPFNFTAIPSGITSTTASPGGTAGSYGGQFTHTFASPGGGQAALERSHVNEQFRGARGATLVVSGKLGTLTVTVNDPNSSTDGWDLDAGGTMTGPDDVTWDNSIDARPFVANASNPSPASRLPQELNATQNFRNLTFPNRTYGGAAVASTTHRRAIEERGNQLKAITSAGVSAEIVDGYAGPTVFRRCRASPPSISAAAPPPSGADAGPAPAPPTSTIAVDQEGQAATPTFSIRPPDLGCTIDASGTLTAGATPGTVTIRAGDATNFDETTVTLTPPVSASPKPAQSP